MRFQPALGTSQAKKRGIQTQLKAAEEQRKQAKNDHRDARSSVGRLAGSGTIDEQVCFGITAGSSGASCPLLQDHRMHIQQHTVHGSDVRNARAQRRCDARTVDIGQTIYLCGHFARTLKS